MDLRILISAVLIALTVARAAVEGLNPDLTLNRAKISKAYFEGDFDMVVDALESFRKVQPNPSREDKIYAYKYLSVIYAAKPETRAKAESYMYQLLKIMPSIELMDLYISDNIEAIFNSVRLRFEQQQRYTGSNPDRAPKPSSAGPASIPAAPAARPSPAGAEKAGNAEAAGDASWIWWTAGAVGVAAVVAGYVYFAATPEPKSAPHDTLDLK